MPDRIQIGQMADSIMKSLNDYADIAAADVKKAVKKTAKDIKNEISVNAPENTGAYAKSWTAKTMKETSESIEITVHSSNRYQLAHLLENGHAKRGGGRVPGRPHIAPAEQNGSAELEKEIRRSLENG